MKRCLAFVFIATLSLSSAAARPEIILFYSDRSNLAAGTGTVLHWQTSNAAICSIESTDPGSGLVKQPVIPNHFMTVTPDRSTTYTLTCNSVEADEPAVSQTLDLTVTISDWNESGSDGATPSSEQMAHHALWGFFTKPIVIGSFAACAASLLALKNLVSRCCFQEKYD